MEKKIYTCICGKQWDNPQSFNGHKSHCKEHQLNKHGSLDNLYQNYSQKNEKLSKFYKEKSEKLKKEKDKLHEIELKKWVKEKHLCEKCGKIMREQYGSKRFCSPECARSFSTSKNRDKINKKVSATIKSKYEYIEYNGKEITLNEYERILDTQHRIEKKKLDIKNKHNKLFKKYKVSESPYSEYDSLYTYKSKDGEIGLQFIKHNEDGQIIERTLVSEYRYIIEREIGRKLSHNEEVHHIDGNHYNNNRKNLIVLTPSIHHKIHKSGLTIEEVIKNNLYIYK